MMFCHRLYLALSKYPVYTRCIRGTHFVGTNEKPAPEQSETGLGFSRNRKITFPVEKLG